MKSTICPHMTVCDYRVLEIDLDDVPNGAYEAFREDDKFVYTLMWEDMFFYHGEDGWCLDDNTLESSEDWLERARESAGLGPTEAFWVRVIHD